MYRRFLQKLDSIFLPILHFPESQNVTLHIHYEPKGNKYVVDAHHGKITREKIG